MICDTHNYRAGIEARGSWIHTQGWMKESERYDLTLSYVTRHVDMWYSQLSCGVRGSWLIYTRTGGDDGD